MKALFALAVAVPLAALPGLASATDVVVHRNVIVLPDADVLIPRRTARTIVIDADNKDCTIRTVRIRVDGHTVLRRVVHCD